MHAQTHIRSLFLIWPFFVYFMSSGNVFVYFMSLGNVFDYFMSWGYVFVYFMSLGNVFDYFMSWGYVFVYFMSLGNVFAYFMFLGYVSSWYSGSNLVTSPPPVGYFRGLWGGGVIGIVTILLLKYICLVFHGENGQIEYILKIFPFTNIVRFISWF